MYMIEASATQTGESMYPERDHFLAHVVVDHIDGVMAELLIHQYFAPASAEWEVL